MDGGSPPCQGDQVLVMLQPCWELLGLPGCLLQSPSASFRALGWIWGIILPFLPPTPPSLCPHHAAQPTAERPSVGFGMDFMALERSSHIPFGFPLNDCIVYLQKNHPILAHLGA